MTTITRVIYEMGMSIRRMKEKVALMSFNRIKYDVNGFTISFIDNGVTLYLYVDCDGRISFSHPQNDEKYVEIPPDHIARYAELIFAALKDIQNDVIHMAFKEHARECKVSDANTELSESVLRMLSNNKNDLVQPSR